LNAELAPRDTMNASTVLVDLLGGDAGRTIARSRSLTSARIRPASRM
jgi:hypothetical protein